MRENSIISRKFRMLLYEAKLFQIKKLKRLFMTVEDDMPKWIMF